MLSSARRRHGHRRPVGRWARAVLVAAALSSPAACSGSGSDASDGPSRAASSTPPSPSRSASSPSSSPSSSLRSSLRSSPGSSPRATGTPSPASATDRLLGADEMPLLRAGHPWTVGSTTTREPRASFGTCQRFAMTSIGAERAVVRRFRAAGRERAGELVATFPDDVTARRAYAVLAAWRATCADRLKGYERVDVGEPQPVTTGGGPASWYLLVYGPVKGHPDTRYLDAQGAALAGRRIAMVSMRQAGRTDDHEPGRGPMVAALGRASQKLG